jgi:hypothetical protein
LQSQLDRARAPFVTARDRFEQYRQRCIAELVLPSLSGLERRQLLDDLKAAKISRY